MRNLAMYFQWIFKKETTIHNFYCYNEIYNCVIARRAAWLIWLIDSNIVKVLSLNHIVDKLCNNFERQEIATILHWLKNLEKLIERCNAKLQNEQQCWLNCKAEFTFIHHESMKIYPWPHIFHLITKNRYVFYFQIKSNFQNRLLKLYILARTLVLNFKWSKLLETFLI